LRQCTTLSGGDLLRRPKPWTWNVLLGAADWQVNDSAFLGVENGTERRTHVDNGHSRSR
jgi:hypothetical protein